MGKERLSPDAGAFPGTSPRGRSLRAVPGAPRTAAAREPREASGDRGRRDAAETLTRAARRCPALPCPELGGVRSAEPRPLRTQSESPVEMLVSAPGSRGRGLRWKAAGTHDSWVGTQ